MLLRRFYNERLAQASYLVGCQRSGEAIVVDPARDPRPYLHLARDQGMRIAMVTETHIHADFMSGSRELARRSGADLLLSGHGGDDWAYRFAKSDEAREITDGYEFAVGEVRFRVMHTPGHTPEHICFLVTDGAVSDVPLALLSGDFVFVGDVGRPDLLERAAGESGTMRDGARALFGSLERFRYLPEHVQVLPGHGAGSACGKALGAVPSSTVGYELLVNWAFQCSSEEEFVDRVLADQPEPPSYFARMKRSNRDGPPPLSFERGPPKLSGDELSDLHDGKCMIIDVRNRYDFAEGHLPGAINIPLALSFVTWCGWIVPPDDPICLIADFRGQIDEALGGLSAIGLDNVVGYSLVGDLGPQACFAHVPTIDWPTAERARQREKAVLVDLRSRTEWNTGHVAGARRVHLGELGRRAHELPTDRPVLLHCKTGHRSAIGASVLSALGHGDVRNVDGGFDDRLARGMPVAGQSD